MKIATLVASLLLLTLPAHAAPDIEFDLLVVQMPEEKSFPIVDGLRDPKRADQTRAEVLKMIASKAAVLVDWPFLQTCSGQRAVVEHVQELRYATEYEAPGTGKITEKKEPVDAPSPSDKPGPKPEAQTVTRAETISEGVPMGFETRNIGVTLELEPVVADDGKTIALSLVPQHNWLNGFRKIEIEQKGTGKTVVVDQPIITTNKVTTAIKVRDGDTTLLNVFKLQDAPGRVELFILRSRIKPFDAKGAFDNPETHSR